MLRRIDDAPELLLLHRIHKQHHAKVAAKRAFAAPLELCDAIVSLGKSFEVNAGKLIFRKGEPSKGVFLVKKGRVALSAGDDPTRITRIAQTGSLLGLPATVTGRPYSLAAEAVVNTTLIRVGAREFKAFLAENPPFCYSVVRMLAEEIITVRRVAVYRV